jgi:hypothetical protein
MAELIPSASWGSWVRRAAAGVAGFVIAATSQAALADEDGVSFWIPGQFGSLAATPLGPGWTVSQTYYHWEGSAGADVAAARLIRIGRFDPTVSVLTSGSLNANVNFVVGDATYAFATPVLGAQATIGMVAVYGRTDATVAANIMGTLGPVPFAGSTTTSQAVTGFGDLYPMATLRWNKGVDNYMWYLTGDIPVGLYSSSNLANIGIGHGAIDSGVGYTYFNPQTGHELSAVTGFTYNFINPETQYQSGVDWHLDWGASQWVNKQLFFGAVGYIYHEIGCDSGSGDKVGCFQSRVFSIGPQIGFVFPIDTPLGPMQGYINMKAYAEFDHQNRPGGWDAWLTFAITPPVTPPAPSPISRSAHRT